MARRSWRLGALVVATGLAAACGAGDEVAATHGNGRATGDGAATGVRAGEDVAANVGALGDGRGQLRVSGKVRSLTEDALVLADGQQVPLAPRTRFVSSGRRISRAQVHPGDEIRASFDPGVDLSSATQVDVRGR